MNPKTMVLGSWVFVAALTTIQWVTDSGNQGFPPPGRYLGSGVLFSMLFLAAGPLGTLAGTAAVGTAGAVLFAPYLKGQQSSVLQGLGQWLGQVAGSPKTG